MRGTAVAPSAAAPAPGPTTANRTPVIGHTTQHTSLRESQQRRTKQSAVTPAFSHNLPSPPVLGPGKVTTKRASRLPHTHPSHGLTISVSISCNHLTCTASCRKVVREYGDPGATAAAMAAAPPAPLGLTGSSWCRSAPARLRDTKAGVSQARGHERISECSS
jgi:hypothetical protein